MVRSRQHSEKAPEMRLDVRGLNCPLPVLKARKAIASLPSGTRLEILATDPMAAIDVPNWCREAGHRLIEAGAPDAGGVCRFVVEKG